MQNETKIILKSGKDQSLRRFHPWVFSGAIKKIIGTPPAEGDIVSVFSNHDEFLGKGHYQPDSIAVRILTFDDEAIDNTFWGKRLRAAYGLRKQLGFINNPSGNVFRLVHAEGDQMPGLIVDIYGRTAVIQAHSVGMYKAVEHIVPYLLEVFEGQIKAIYNKSENTLPHKSNIDASNGYLMNEENSTEIREHGCVFSIDWEKGQKTGFFIDQRENRNLLSLYAKNKSLCNLFGYTGGFSVYALKNGAKHVDTIDSSAQAIEQCNHNIALNGMAESHNGIVADAFEYLQNMEEEYDIIILDPPAFAKHHKVLHNALQGYKRLNEAALRKIKPGGIIFTFSCSQVVSRDNFKRSVFVAAANTKRHVRILHQMSQPEDHPISIYHPESEYLKGFVLQVE